MYLTNIKASVACFKSLRLVNHQIKLHCLYVKTALGKMIVFIVQITKI